MHPIGKLRNFQYEWQQRQEKIRRGILQRFYNPIGASTPGFLVGCGRSGTSVLVRRLATSWQIELYNEHHPAAFENFRLRDLDVVSDLVDRSHAYVTLFKPILSTTMAPALLDRFPGAKMIFAFRHYDDVVNSSIKKFGLENRINHVRSWMADGFGEFAAAPPPEKTMAFIRERWKPDLNPESGAALYWLFYNRLFYDLNLIECERTFLIHYETLVNEPREQFSALTDFLGIEFREEMIEGIFCSSIGRDPAPNIDDGIRADCEALYRQMAEDARRYRASAE